MATHKSALKRHRQSLQRRDRNRARKSQMKTAVKKLVSAMENKDADTLQAALKESQSVIAKTASRGVIHKKTASRKISRLTRRAQRALQAES